MNMLSASFPRAQMVMVCRRYSARAALMHWPDEFLRNALRQTPHGTVAQVMRQPCRRRVAPRRRAALPASACHHWQPRATGCATRLCQCADRAWPGEEPTVAACHAALAADLNARRVWGVERDHRHARQLGAAVPPAETAMTRGRTNRALLGQVRLYLPRGRPLPAGRWHAGEA